MDFKKNNFLFLLVFILLLAQKLNAQVNANFSATPQAGCAPLTVQFTDLSTGGATTWNWNFGNSNSSPLQNPSAIYANPGTYTVILTASNGTSSNTKTQTAYIVVYNKPIANYTINNDSVCVGDIVSFSDASTVSTGGAAIAQWSWDFGDGTVQSSTNGLASHSYTNPGSYPVTLIITDINGCSNSIIKNIIVIQKPVVNFSANSISSCTAPLTVTFTNSSTITGAATYLWRFGDGTTSASNNPSHTYTALGLYSVTLIVNQNGCIDSLVKTNYVQLQNINASFVATPTTVCSGQTVTFTSTTIPTASSSLWNFGDVNTSTSLNPTHIYAAAGVYTVTLIEAIGNCKDTLILTNYITVNATPVAAFSPNNNSVCAFPTTVAFTDASNGAATWSWSFGDGGTSSLQNPSHSYNTIGTNTVSLIISNANNTCFDTISKPNFINYSPPVANFSTQPDSGCVPLTVNFTDASTSVVSAITAHYWNFGDGVIDTSATPGAVHICTTPGIFNITYIIETANGCRDTIVCNGCVRAGNKPNAVFGIVDDTVCYGDPVSFVDSTLNATGWLWMFGDGASNTTPNPTHVYGVPGTFNPYLIAYNNGCADTSVIKPVVIHPPKAQFTVTHSCINYYTVAFTSTSIGADSLFWDLGDGSQDSSNAVSFSHTYTSRGNYTVSLTAYNFASGCSHTITVSLTIAIPIASFTQSLNSGCYPIIVNFNSTSQDAFFWSWTLGNGSTTATSTASTSSTYSLPGANAITLIITDVNGCKDTATNTVLSLGPIPHFYADTLKGCTPLSVTFVDTSSSDSTMVQWIWNFGDGTIDTTSNDSIVHIYTTPGVYTVAMTVKDTNGCSKAITISNYIRPTFPYPAFTVDTFACAGEVLTFNAAATVAAGATYIWDFDDGTVDTTSNNSITHSFSTDNVYNVMLTVVDSNGCDSTLLVNVRIERPLANFGWNIINSGCGTLQVAFTDSSQQFITAWQWSFGNGATSNLQHPTYTYTSPGVYSVTLVVTNAAGCKDTIKLDSIIVVYGPVGSYTFAPTSGCVPLTVTFYANSYNAQQFVWDFGDGVVINGNDTITHTYGYASTFNPILILGNSLPNGNLCLLPASNLSGNIVSVNAFPVSINPSIITIPEDSMYTVFPTVGGALSPIYSWEPPFNVNCPSCQNVIITGSGDTITYFFSVTDSNGCVNSDSLLVISPECIKEKMVPNVFTPNGDGENDLFFIPGVCNSEDYSLNIYNRWGVIMFSTKNRGTRWDGYTMAGEQAPDGVYYFIVTVFDKIYSGSIQLLR